MKRLWPLALATTIGLIILCGLGTWQIFRLGEKTKMIDQLEARMAAAPISLDEALKRQAKGEDVEYLRVEFSGSPNWAQSLNKITAADGKPAWEIIVPVISIEGIAALVDAGTAPEKISTETLSQSETINGIIRLHRKGRGVFDNDNDVSTNTWYWWDVPEMLAAANLPADAQVAPFIVQKLPTDGGDTIARPQTPKVELSNNHLGYAITWFGLAVALLAVAAVLGRSMLLDPNKRQG